MKSQEWILKAWLMLTKVYERLDLQGTSDRPATIIEKSEIKPFLFLPVPDEPDMEFVKQVAFGYSQYLKAGNEGSEEVLWIGYLKSKYFPKFIIK